jgi:hypothetical protein
MYEVGAGLGTCGDRVRRAGTVSICRIHGPQNRPDLLANRATAVERALHEHPVENLSVIGYIAVQDVCRVGEDTE